MDSMKPDRLTANPSEQQLAEWAHARNISKLRSALQLLTQPGGEQDLVKKLEALNLKIQLGQIFSDAKSGLTELYEARPEVSKTDVDKAVEAKQNTAQRISTFEDQISGYLKVFRSHVDEACAPEHKVTPSFAAIEGALEGEGTSQKVLEQLSLIGNAPVKSRKQVAERAMDIKSGVTEVLWEIVGTGRDFVGMSAGNEHDQMLKNCLSVWQGNIEDGFSTADSLLSETAKWLEK